MRFVKCASLGLVLVLAAACSSGGSSSKAAPTTVSTTTVAPLTKAAYIARANAICTVMNRRADAVADPGSDPDRAADALEQVRSIIGETLVKLRALPVPPGEAAKLGAIYAKADALRAGMNSYIVALRAHDAQAASAAARRLDTLGNAANAASNAYGLTVCGS